MKYSSYTKKQLLSKYINRPWYVYVGLVYLITLMIVIYSRIGYINNPKIISQQITYEQIHKDIKKKSWHVIYEYASGDYLVTKNVYYDLEDYKYYKDTNTIPRPYNEKCYVLLFFALLLLFIYVMFFIIRENLFTENPVYLVVSVCVFIITLIAITNIFV
jgi:magnesium-transporting ATPase (P-type)